MQSKRMMAFCAILLTAGLSTQTWARKSPKDQLAPQTTFETPDLPFIPRCPPDIDHYHEWFTNRRPPAGDIRALPGSSIIPIPPDNHDRAVQMLSDVEFVPLSKDAFLALAGPSMPSGIEPGVTPYLVRNVLPYEVLGLRRAASEIKLASNVVMIKMGTFGCFGLKRNPLIVLLDTAPERVDVEAAEIF